ncbi:MAG: chemotaxis protein CheW [Desulfuromonas sp.]|nr:MAG: chemotaxis protein CheW [Desulfuromonas sp.]
MTNRALAPSHHKDSGSAGRTEIQLACFRVGREMYALDIMQIKEIIRPQKLTPIPKSPAFVEGVINLRGAVIPVADMRKRFDLPLTESDRKSRIMICSLAGRMIGLLVDEVSEVRRYSRDEVAPAPEFLKGPEAEYFLGVARSGDDFIMLVDLEKILSSSEKLALKDLAVRPQVTGNN